MQATRLIHGPVENPAIVRRAFEMVDRMPGDRDAAEAIILALSLARLEARYPVVDEREHDGCLYAFCYESNAHVPDEVVNLGECAA